MTDSISKCGNYKKSGNSLYELQNNSWVHVMRLGTKIKGVEQAKREFLD